MTRTPREQANLDQVRKLVANAVREPQTVPVNMYETTNGLVIIAPLVGVMPEDVTVTVESGALVIDAEERAPATRDHILHEWTFGPYCRTVTLPPGYGTISSATLANGQLVIRLQQGDAGPNGQVLQPHTVG
jgi:HSP20 family molecular chaperone IbpA